MKKSTKFWILVLILITIFLNIWMIVTWPVFDEYGNTTNARDSIVNFCDIWISIIDAGWLYVLGIIYIPRLNTWIDSL